MFNELFKQDEQKKATNRGNQMSNTATLTQMSTEIAREILKTAEEDKEKYREVVAESQKSHDVMDKLIADTYDLQSVDAEFLKDESEEVLDRMIKSQQSKRSRAKSKKMTLDNYITMLTGAVAENILRIVANKPKQAGGGGSRRGRVTYTEEELEALSNDTEALTKAIRNVQSKKSIDRRKADFDEESERWQQLLEAEQQLIAIRDGKSKQAEEALNKTNQLEDMLATVDPKDLKASDAKGMLDSIKEMLATK